MHTANYEVTPLFAIMNLQRCDARAPARRVSLRRRALALPLVGREPHRINGD
jgi:hypothetical protein